MKYIPKQKQCVHPYSKCIGYRCIYFRRGDCKGSIKSITDRDGNYLASVRPLAFEDNNVEEVLMEAFDEMESRGYLTNERVIEVLKRKYSINITKGLLKYYATERLIEKGFKRRIPGRKGTVSFYRSDTPEKIYFIRYVQTFFRFTLKQIAEYSKVLLMEDKEKLDTYKNYKIKFLKDKSGRQYIRFDGEVFNELASFQEFSILRALFEVGNLNYKNKQVLPFDATVKITKDDKGKDIVSVYLGKDINKEVVFSSKSVTVK